MLGDFSQCEQLKYSAIVLCEQASHGVRGASECSWYHQPVRKHSEISGQINLTRTPMFSWTPGDGIAKPPKAFFGKDGGR